MEPGEPIQDKPAPPIMPPRAPSLGSQLADSASRVSWVAGFALALSSFMGWYSGSATEGPTVSVLGWNTGTPGKLVFVFGIAVILLALRREVDIELPRSLPEGVILIVLGTAATVCVLIRLISIPDELAGTANRAVGLWVALASAVIVIVAGLVRAREEL